MFISEEQREKYNQMLAAAQIKMSTLQYERQSKLKDTQFINVHHTDMIKLASKNSRISRFFAKLERKLDLVEKAAKAHYFNLLNLTFEKENILVPATNAAVKLLNKIDFSDDYKLKSHIRLASSFNNLYYNEQAMLLILENDISNDSELISFSELALDMMKDNSVKRDNKDSIVTVKLVTQKGDITHASSKPNAVIQPVSIKTIFNDVSEHIVSLNMHPDAKIESINSVLDNLAIASAHIHQYDIAANVLSGRFNKNDPLYQDGLKILFMNSLNGHIAHMHPAIHENNPLHKETAKIGSLFSNQFRPYIRYKNGI